MRYTAIKTGNLSAKFSAPWQEGPTAAHRFDSLRKIGTARALTILCMMLAGSIVFAGNLFAADPTPAMIVPGQFSVDDVGAFTYTIPIAVPPGTAGMVPALSLDYSSQNGDGLEGMGWTLNGLPSITRCPQTLAQDGAHGGVSYQQDSTLTGTLDRFCMEGQRLVLITPGVAYGSAGSEYRTEVDNFSKIVAYGYAGAGPEYFIVQTKSGQTMEFGKNTDADVILPGTANIKAWAVDKITDTKGNFMTITYNTNTDRTMYGNTYPVKIAYTGNGSNAPYNSVQFSYKARLCDPSGGTFTCSPNYQAGVATYATALLTDIKTYININTAPTLVSDYKLSYTMASNNAQHDELDSVTLCGATGACLNPTTFTWQGSGSTLSYTQVLNNVAHGLTSGKPNDFNADYNADGLTDATVLAPEGSLCNTTYSIYTATPPDIIEYPSMTMTVNPSFSTPYDCSGSAMFHNNLSAIVDLDGDGFSDIFEQSYSATDHAFIFHNNQAGVFVAENYVQTGPQLLTGDFDGDGRTDFMQQASDVVTPNFSNGNGTFTAGGSINLGGSTLFTGDFDGDGCTDILSQGAVTHVVNNFKCVATLGITAHDW